MRVSRSYWLGLGSGLILSALLTIVFSPLQGQAEAPRDPSALTDVQQAPPTPIDSNPNIDPDPNIDSDPSIDSDPEKPSEETQSTQVDQSSEESASPMDREFIIPKGASAERIADLLVAQDFINDKNTFLEGARHLGVESRFRAGTFNLSASLTTEELLLRLVKN